MDDDLRRMLKQFQLDGYLLHLEEQKVDLQLLHQRPAELVDLLTKGWPIGDQVRMRALIESIQADGSGNEKESIAVVLDTLPTPLALSFKLALDERSSRIALMDACHAIEISLRVLVALGLSEHENLPSALAREIAQFIERPTLGHWLRLADTTCRNPAEASVLAELPRTVGAFSELLGSGREASLETHFLPLRNRLVHGGPMLRAESDRLWRIWRPKISHLVQRELAWLGRVAFLGFVDAMNCFHLVGPSDSAPSPPALPGYLPQGRVGACHAIVGTKVLELGPLGCFDPRRLSAQIFTRRGETRLEYLRIGMTSGVAESDEHMLEWFKRRFLTDRPVARHDSVRDFAAEIAREGARRVGRDRELATLLGALRSGADQVFWVSGPPGAGKSTLFAAAACEMMRDLAPYDLVLVYRFKSGDDRCSRASFLTFVAERLEREVERLRPGKSSPGASGLSASSTDRFVKALKQLPHGARLLICIDGLDEIHAIDRSFAREVVESCLIGSHCSVFCCGRPEGELVGLFGRHSAATPIGEALGPMESDDVRAMLIESLWGSALRELVQLDAEMADAEGWARVRNEFVEAVCDRSAGLPIYVNHVIGDLHRGEFSPKNPDRLPRGLHEYHERLLAREELDDDLVIRIAIIALLAIVRTALSVAEIRCFLVRRGVLPASASPIAPDARVSLLLASLSTVLRRSVAFDEVDRYALYHHSFRTHVLSSNRLRASVAATRESMVRQYAQVGDDELSPYLHRYRVSGFVEEGRVAEAVEVLTDLRAVMRQFELLGERCDVVSEWTADWEMVAMHPGYSRSERTEAWHAFVQLAPNHLRRQGWPVHELLLQAALEHGVDSPVTESAQAIVAAGGVRFPVLVPRCSSLSWRGATVASGRAHEIPAGASGGLVPMPGSRVVAWSLSKERLLRISVVRGGSGCTELDAEMSVDPGRFAELGEPRAFDREGVVRIVVDRVPIRQEPLLVVEQLDEQEADCETGSAPPMNGRALHCRIISLREDSELHRAGLRASDVLAWIEEVPAMALAAPEGPPCHAGSQGGAQLLRACLALVGERFRFYAQRDGRPLAVEATIEAPGILEVTGDTDCFAEEPADAGNHGTLDLESEPDDEGRGRIIERVFCRDTAQADLLAGDVILRWNSHEVPTHSHLRRWCAAARGDGPVLLTILREGSVLQISLGLPRVKDRPRVLGVEDGALRSLTQQESLGELLGGLAHRMQRLRLSPSRRTAALSDRHALRWTRIERVGRQGTDDGIEIVDRATGEAAQRIRLNRYPRIALRLRDDCFAVLYTPVMGQVEWSVFELRESAWMQTLGRRLETPEGTWRQVAVAGACHPAVLVGRYGSASSEDLYAVQRSINRLGVSVDSTDFPPWWRGEPSVVLEHRIGPSTACEGTAEAGLSDEVRTLFSRGFSADSASDERESAGLEIHLAGWHRGSVQHVCVFGEDRAASWDARGVLYFWDLQRARLASDAAAWKNLQKNYSIAGNGEWVSSTVHNDAFHIHRLCDFGDPGRSVKVDGRMWWPCGSNGLIVLLDERSLQRFAVDPTGLGVQPVGVTVVHDEPVVCAAVDAMGFMAVSGLGGVSVYRTESGERCFYRGDLRAPFDRIELLANGLMLLCSRWSGVSALLELATGRDVLPPIPAGHCLRLAGGGRILYRGLGAPDLKAVRRAGDGPEHSRPIEDFAFDTFEPRLGSMFEIKPDGSCRSLQIPSGQPLGRAFVNDASLVAHVAGDWRAIDLADGSGVRISRREALGRLHAGSEVSEDCAYWLFDTIKVTMIDGASVNGRMSILSRAGGSAVMELVLPAAEHDSGVGHPWRAVTPPTIT